MVRWELVLVGADCIFVPGVKEPDTTGALVREIPGPLNVLAEPGVHGPGVVALGVRRVSLDPGPVRALMGPARRIGRELLENGAYSSMVDGAIPYPEANALFERRA